MNLIERFSKAATRLLGEPEYKVKIFPKGSWKNEVTVMEVFDNNDKYIGQREYHSLLEARVNAGRERIRARLEWAIGMGVGIAGSLTLSKSNLFDPSSVNGPLLLAGIGLGVLGGMMIVHGIERSRITSPIIQELSKT